MNLIWVKRFDWRLRVQTNLALWIHDPRPISKFLSPNDHHYKLARHFSHTYVTPTPIQQTACPLIVIQWFNKGRDLHGNAGSPIREKHFTVCCVSKKAFSGFRTVCALHTRIQVVTVCDLMLFLSHIICMRYMSDKNELLRVITIDFAIFLFTISVCTGFAEDRVGMKYDSRCKN